MGFELRISKNVQHGRYIDVTVKKHNRNYNIQTPPHPTFCCSQIQLVCALFQFKKNDYTRFVCGGIQ